MEKTKKKAIISEHAKHEGDTGSTEVQVAVLTARINQLAEHLKNNHQDQHSRMSLMQLIGKRKRLLVYLAGEDVERYRALIAKLGLRK